MSAWLAVLAVLGAASAGTTRSHGEHARGGLSTTAIESTLVNAPGVFLAWHSANPVATVAPQVTRGIEVVPEFSYPPDPRVAVRLLRNGAAHPSRVFAARRPSLVGVVELRI